MLYLIGGDLPDDDYTTLVPPVKQINHNERKLPDIPKIIEHKENDLSPKKGILSTKTTYLLKYIY